VTQTTSSGSSQATTPSSTSRGSREAGSEVSVLVSSPYSSFEDYDDNGVKVRFIPLQDIAWHDAHLSHLAAAPLYRRWIAAGLAAGAAIEVEFAAVLYHAGAGIDGIAPDGTVSVRR